MHADGLVTRTDNRHWAPYQLSAFGESLSPVHRALSDWSQTNLSLGEVAGAERVEDAIRVCTSGMRPPSSRSSTRAAPCGSSTSPRIRPGQRLHPPTPQPASRRRPGHPHRTAPRRPLRPDGSRTGAGPRLRGRRTLEQPRRHAQALVTHGPVTEATRTRTGVPPGPDGVRTAAALRRSTAAPNGLFSHAPQPQPRVPTAAVTAQSTTSRGR
ncbi:hypothetical protein ACIQNU_42760 [Streptomyces sp. NPDC091292]|uniref:hypothetical protein n=1 Tax=Streptomyces sp. NPDC091292 TaxID=3365991 RepID=UPI003818F09B